MSINKKLFKGEINMSSEIQVGLVSIVIPAYNYGEFIIDALDCLKKQTYSNIEVIIIDDGSIDDTSTIVNCWRLKNESVFNNFVYLKLPRNCSSSWALNIGFYISKGEFIVIHDADDFSHENKISIQLNWLSEHPEASAVGTSYNVVNSNKEFVFLPGWLNFNRQEIKVNYQENSEHCVCFGTLMFRRGILRKVTGIKKIPEIRNDIIFIGELIYYGYIVDNLDLKLFSVRLHQKQKTGPKDFQKDSFNIFPERVSVLIPVRYTNSLLETLYRTAVQSYPDIEVIIVDDTLQGDIKPIISEWKTIYKQLNFGGVIKDLIYFQIPTEVGSPMVYNISSYLAKGKYIYFSGNESLIDKNELLNSVRILNGNWPYSGIATNSYGDKIPLNWNNDFNNNGINSNTDVSKTNYKSIMLTTDVIDRTGGLAQGYKLHLC